MLMLVGCAAGGVSEHRDDGPGGDSHPLSIYGGGGGMSVLPPEGRHPGEPWSATFGSFIPCLDDDRPMTISGFDWTSPAGLEPRSVVAYLRTFDRSETDPYLSMLGTPADPLDKYFEESPGTITEGIQGHGVTVQCADAFNGRVEEIMLAVEVDDAGALLEDVSFDYESESGRKYRVVTDWKLYVCGDKVPEAGVSCGAGGPPE
ncbi:hypothetical protein [Promicromonospora sp. NPDC023805]|uniref:hypothetical protein n=1 Tax=Promicromonospora sp. NPDC023805 TaxID=3154696 RepID=UPI0033C06957